MNSKRLAKSAARQAVWYASSMLKQVGVLTEPERQTDQVFAQIFRTNGFGGEESISGPGSSLAETAVIREQLPSLLIRLSARSLLDAACGDLHWIRHVELPVDSYIGVDVVPELIEADRQAFDDPRRQFLCLDLARDDLPRVDAILCRDCLVHLPFAEAFRILRNFQRSGSRYLLTTSFSDQPFNYDIPKGKWRPVNLARSPFAFPPPLVLLNEGCNERGGEYPDKCLGVWELQSLPLA